MNKRPSRNELVYERFLVEFAEAPNEHLLKWAAALAATLAERSRQQSARDKLPCALPFDFTQRELREFFADDPTANALLPEPMSQHDVLLNRVRRTRLVKAQVKERWLEWRRGGLPRYHDAVQFAEDTVDRFPSLSAADLDVLIGWDGEWAQERSK